METSNEFNFTVLPVPDVVWLVTYVPMYHVDLLLPSSW